MAIMCDDCGTTYVDQAHRHRDFAIRLKAGMDPGDCRCVVLVPAPPPECGHSACSQNFIDTGDAGCIDNYDGGDDGDAWSGGFAENH